MRRSTRCLAALVLCGAVFAAGCAELIDIDKRAMVVGVAIDTAPPPNRYMVTIQYLVPSAGGGGGGSVLGAGGAQSAAGQAVTASESGISIADAVRELQGETARFIYFGNLTTILIGESLARRGVFAPLDFFLRDGEVAESTQVLVVRGQASALLLQKSTVSAGGAALPLFEYLRLAEHASYPTTPNVLWRFLAPLYSHGRAAYAPIFEPLPGHLFHELGAGLFLDGRLVGQVDGYDENVLDWLVKDGGDPNALVRLPGSATPVALRVVQSRFSIRVLGPEDAGVRLLLDTSIREGDGITIGSSDLSRLEHDAALQIKGQVRHVLDILQRAGTDLLGVHDRVFARYPRESADWPSVFSHLRLHLSVTVRIFEGGRKT